MKAWWSSIPPCSDRWWQPSSAVGVLGPLAFESVMGWLIGTGFDDKSDATTMRTVLVLFLGDGSVQLHAPMPLLCSPDRTA